VVTSWANSYVSAMLLAGISELVQASCRIVYRMRGHAVEVIEMQLDAAVDERNLRRTRFEQ
jgi:hypothetical protein